MKAHKKSLPIEGWPRPYMRDGVPCLPLDRQYEMLIEIGVDLSDERALYVDRLSRPKIQAKAPLPQRDYALSPRKQGEVVYVASLRVLGWNHLEVVSAMETAAKHGASIHCADTGETYCGDTPAQEILSAIRRVEEARRRARMTPATTAAKATRKRRLQIGLAIAREHWGRPPGEISVVEIAKIASLSVRTLYTHLPPRTQSQEETLYGKRHA